MIHNAFVYTGTDNPGNLGYSKMFDSHKLLAAKSNRNFLLLYYCLYQKRELPPTHFFIAENQEFAFPPLPSLLTFSPSTETIMSTSSASLEGSPFTRADAFLLSLQLMWDVFLNERRSCHPLLMIMIASRKPTNPRYFQKLTII